jgi:hypothetical protein
MQGMYNVQSMDQNLWPNNCYTVPFLNCADTYSSQPAAAPVTYYDPPVQYTRVLYLLCSSDLCHPIKMCSAVLTYVYMHVFGVKLV